jgi:hypothetical protein
MPKTINAYVSDLGEVEVTLNAGNVAAVAAFTTAESIVIDGAVRTFQRTNSPKKASSRMNVTGDTTPIVTRSGRIQEEELWELVLVDDYFSGAAGEWGTDDLSAVEIFRELLAANQDPGGIKCTPAGGSAAHIEITLVTPRLLGVDVPKIDADSTDPEVVKVYLAAEGHTVAAHG